MWRWCLAFVDMLCHSSSILRSRIRIEPKCVAQCDVMSCNIWGLQFMAFSKWTWENGMFASPGLFKLCVSTTQSRPIHEIIIWFDWEAILIIITFIPYIMQIQYFFLLHICDTDLLYGEIDCGLVRLCTLTVSLNNHYIYSKYTCSPNQITTCETIIKWIFVQMQFVCFAGDWMRMGKRLLYWHRGSYN